MHSAQYGTLDAEITAAQAQVWFTFEQLSLFRVTFMKDVTESLFERQVHSKDPIMKFLDTFAEDPKQPQNATKKEPKAAQKDPKAAQKELKAAQKQPKADNPDLHLEELQKKAGA